MIDGPNEYCYVRQNPWTAFDPEGLARPEVDGTDLHVHTYIPGRGAVVYTPIYDSKTNTWSVQSKGNHFWGDDVKAFAQKEWDGLTRNQKFLKDAKAMYQSAKEKYQIGKKGSELDDSNAKYDAKIGQYDNMIEGQRPDAPRGSPKVIPPSMLKAQAAADAAAKQAATEQADYDRGRAAGGGTDAEGVLGKLGRINEVMSFFIMFTDLVNAASPEYQQALDRNGMAYAFAKSRVPPDQKDGTYSPEQQKKLQKLYEDTYHDLEDTAREYRPNFT